MHLTKSRFHKKQREKDDLDWRSYDLARMEMERGSLDWWKVVLSISLRL